MHLEDLVTKKEGARLLGIAESTLNHWLTQKKLRRIKAGSRTLVSKTDLIALLTVEEAAR